MRWNEASPLWNAIAILVGFALLIGGIMTGSLLHMIFFGGAGGIILALAFGRIFGEGIGDAVYFKRDKLERPAERLDYLKGLIEEERYAEAEAGLKLVLLRDFMDTEARMLLVRTFRERMDGNGAAVETCREYFDHPGHISNRDSVDMLLYLSDILPPEEAAGYLRRELKRGRYSNYDRQILRNRLEAL